MAYQNNNYEKKPSTLRNLMGKGFKFNNLFEVQLIEDIKPELNQYSEKYFMFFSGKRKNQETGKWGTEQQNHISIKISFEKALAFANSIKMVANGKPTLFQIYADMNKSEFKSNNQQYNNGQHNGQAEIKTLKVSSYPSKKDDPNSIKYIGLNFTSNKKEKINIGMTIEDAYSVITYIEKYVDEGIKFENSFRMNFKPQISNGGDGGRSSQPKYVENQNGNSEMNDFDHEIFNGSE